MKIIFVGINGSELPYTRVRCYNFAQALRKNGIETEVLSFRDHLAPQYDGIQMLELPDNEKLKLNIQAGLRLVRKRKAIFYIQKVHYHSAMPFFLSRLGTNKFILDYDDWDIDRSPLFETACLNRLFFGFNNINKITSQMAAKAVCCVASSRYLYNFLSKYNKKVTYIPTGVDTELFKKREKEPSVKITFVWTGQIWGEVIYNNILELVACFAEVSMCRENIKLRIIGGGTLLPRLRNLVGSDYPGFDIEIIDWVKHEDMPNYLSDSDIGLLPLIPDMHNEAWMKSKSPTKLFEYMAIGLPTVSSRTGEAELIIEDGRDGFLAGNRKEFVEKMKLLIDDYDLRIRMGQFAQEKVKNYYSLDILGKRLSDYIACFL
jgi:glycosyltransferase involved in cell wall biosynthesis